MNDYISKPSTSGGVGQTRRKNPPLDLSFDFLNAEEMRPLPVHQVELHQAENRRWRSAAIAHDVTKQEFAAMHGITLEDTRDPHTQMSFLDYDNAMREYYGDPEDEAYLEFIRSLSRVLANHTWLKGNSFLEKGVADDYTRLKMFEDDALQLFGTVQEEHIMALEDHVYSEVQSSAHREFLQKYREEKSPDPILLRLAFEQKRRSCDPPGTSTEVHKITSECLSISVPKQRQWKGKQYKKNFLGLCKEEKATPMLE
ncbi:hypothetical protein LSM04_002344 [Trypanosoma melophagium]|uniref:uncharacterized protein n=1 Tax=Trypanosoma melophagium TaxID=715481 RepID=UPI00351A9B32|nr:hypothetical protein LSM04_002344 [Trypanosoma melophagium]